LHFAIIRAAYELASADFAFMAAMVCGVSQMRGCAPLTAGAADAGGATTHTLAIAATLMSKDRWRGSMRAKSVW
jgi:hypothetical protein